ncbi:MAG: LysM peptidoglycan-binding domain-containing protein [Anaerolineae bacterium]|nr:LysM peptidoglycan-binding domain-containing protein [Anaerolineae bacterium]
MLFLITFAGVAGVVSAQVPFVSILSPANGTTITNLGSPLNVSIQFGNAPEPDSFGSPSLLVRAYDSNNNVINQSATIDLTTIPWNTTIEISTATPGTSGYLIAQMLDSQGSQIAVSPQINVTYGSAPVATNTPTATATNPATATPTATSGGPQPGISVISPASGATVDPIAGFPVTGDTSNLPVGATVLVRLRNANGETLGEQGVVPVSGQTWNVTLKKTLSNIATTGNGSMIAFLILSGNVVAQTNAIPLNFTGSPAPAITITSPTNGTTVNVASPVAVSGTVTGAPVGATVLVQAFVNGNPNPVGQQTVTPGATTWSASITFNVPVSNGASGYLIAYLISSNAAIATSNTVTVVWGLVSTNPFVQITFPPQGSVLPIGSPFQVNGTAVNVFGNTVTVRALDTFGNVLAQMTTTNAPSTNTWQTLLTVSNVPPGTPGRLYAFATNPQNGAVVASSTVNVFYGAQCYVRTDWPIYIVQVGDTLLRVAQRTGSTVTELAYGNCLPNANLVYVGQQLRVPRLPQTAPPSQVTINIVTPIQNAVLDTSQRVVVTGTGSGIAGNDVVVRALDDNGDLLSQQTVRVNGADGSGASTWQVSLSILVNDDTQGTIYAFAQAPSTGAVMADDIVEVLFSSPIPAEGAEQQLIITQPISDTSVPPGGEMQVAGQVIGAFEGDIFVRALDNQGNVLGEVPATVTEADDQGNASWQALLNVLNVPSGTRGIIYAYIGAPFTNSPRIADAVNVIFGQPETGPFVTITDPLPYSVLDISIPINVTGKGGALFEGNVVVRALDELGNVLDEKATTVNAPDAGTGGAGPWQTALNVNVAEGTRGSIIAFSTSAQDGSIVAFASIYVTYGDVTATDDFVKINTPLPDTLVDPSQTLMIAGIADRSNGNSVKVQIVDSQGNVLVDQPRNVNPSLDGDFGIWQMLIELRSMPAGTRLHITAMTTSRFDGSTLATDSIDIVVGPSSTP